jgi:hypothetical protein
MYRYIDEQDSSSIKYGISLANVKLLEFEIVKETPKGWWIRDKRFTGVYSYFYIGDKPKWVSKTGKKRFAYPTKKEALFSYIKRKEKQVAIFTHKLDVAISALNQAKKIEL